MNIEKLAYGVLNEHGVLDATFATFVCFRVFSVVTAVAVVVASVLLTATICHRKQKCEKRAYFLHAKISKLIVFVNFLNLFVLVVLNSEIVQICLFYPL